MRCLLDKVIVRHIIEGQVKLQQAEKLSKEELFSLDLFRRGKIGTHRLFVVPPTVNILKRIQQNSAWATTIDLFLQQVTVVSATRYYSRWSRRLRDAGFTREDAAVLALGTFSTIEDGSVLGMHAVVTYDWAMINNWMAQHKHITQRFTQMCTAIELPYTNARLPRLLVPEQVV